MNYRRKTHKRQKRRQKTRKMRAGAPPPQRFIDYVNSPQCCPKYELVALINDRKFDEARYLISVNKANFRHLTASKNNALMVALIMSFRVSSMYDEIQRFCLELIPHVSLSTINQEGYTPLMLACKAGMYLVAFQILESRNDIHVTQISADKETALLLAIKNNLYPVASKILQTIPNSEVVNTVDQSGRNALDYLLDEPVDPNNQMLEYCIRSIVMMPQSNLAFVDPYDGQTPLMMAISSGRSNMSQTIIEEAESSGRNLNLAATTIPSKNNALHIACLGAMNNVVYKLIVMSLMARSHILGKPNIYGETPLMLALSSNNAKSNIDMLIHSGRANLKQQDNDGYTALMYTFADMLDYSAQTKIIINGSEDYNPNAFYYLNSKTALFMMILKCQSICNLEPELIKMIGNMSDWAINLVNVYGQKASSEFVTNEKIMNILTNRQIRVDVNGKEAFDAVMHENVNVSEYLAEPDNIVFVYNGSFYATSKTIIQQVSDDARVYKCYAATGSLNAPNSLNNENVYSSTMLFKLRVLGIPLDYVWFSNIEGVLASNEQLFMLSDTGTSVPSVVSFAVLNGGEWMSGAHCQDGQGGKIYAISFVERV